MNKLNTMTKEEIQAKIEVLENIGGYTIEIDALKVEQKKAKSIGKIKKEFAANQIKAFCEHVMHPDSDLHKDAEWWIKEYLSE
jgi:hypothetical protein